MFTCHSSGSDLANEYVVALLRLIWCFPTNAITAKKNDRIEELMQI